MKQQIPRSARDVLARQTAADEHPAADLLSGFMEHALSSDENARVTTHLAACADCREILFLASAATPEEQRAVAAAQYVPIVAAKVSDVRPAATGFQRPHLAWLSWKWAVPALAALVMVAGVVVRQVTRTQGAATQTVAMNAGSSPPTSPGETNALSATTSESARAVTLPPSPKPTAEVKASSKERSPAPADGVEARAGTAEAAGEFGDARAAGPASVAGTGCEGPRDYSSGNACAASGRRRKLRRSRSPRQLRRRRRRRIRRRHGSRAGTGT